MPELYLKCKEKNCGVEFPSGIVMDRKSFETTILAGNYHTCPKGHTHQYNKKDYFFK
jgi:hypothetical protein